MTTGTSWAVALACACLVSVVDARVQEPYRLKQLTDDPAQDGFPSRSPDGSLLAVVRCEGRNCNLWVMSAAGGKRVQVTSHPGYDDGPSWSPDGRRIAFVSTRSGNFEIWTVEIDLESVRRELNALAR